MGAMPPDSVYAVASGKGGVGKTTTTVNLGTVLARADRRVAVVDADLGMANLAGFVSLDPGDVTLHDVLAGDATVQEATYRLADGLFAVPSASDLLRYTDVAVEGLRVVVDTLRSAFDYVFLDLGAGVSRETVVPLGLADGVVLVSTTDPVAVRDAEKTLELVDRADGRVAGLVVTRVHPGESGTIENIAERLGSDVLGSVPEDGAVRRSVRSGRPVVVDDPNGPGATAYRRIAARLVADADDDIETETDADRDGETTDGTDADGASSDEVADAVSDFEFGGLEDEGTDKAPSEEETNTVSGFEFGEKERN
jgi:septum site-determining protein MinD